MLYPVATTDTVLAPETEARLMVYHPRPTAQQIAVTAGTTGGSETRRADIHHYALSTLSETAATGFDGGRHLFHKFRPSFNHRPSQQTEICGRNRFRPLRSSQTARPSARVAPVTISSQTTVHPYRPSNKLGLRRDFTWRFGVSDIQLPIIGLDLLAKFNLLFDCRNNRILDGVTSLSTPALRATKQFPIIKKIGSNTPADDLLAEFLDLTRPSGVPREVRHNTIHHVRTTPDTPVFKQTRRLAPHRLPIAKDEFDATLKDGMARRSDCPWSSELHLVPNKDNDWRPCGD